MIAKLGKKNVIESLSLVTHDDLGPTSVLIGGVTVIVVVGDDGGSFTSYSKIEDEAVVLTFRNIGGLGFNDFTITVSGERRHLLAFVSAVGAVGSQAYRITLTLAED